jgi:hypothetical protein
MSEEKKNPVESPPEAVVEDLERLETKKRFSLRISSHALILLSLTVTVLALGVGLAWEVVNDEGVDSSPSSNAASTQESKEAVVGELSYRIVDTNQLLCYDDEQSVACPEASARYFGQDAQYSGNMPSYTDNGDGTITDNITGLMWQKAVADKTSYSAVVNGASSFSLAGHNDWRVPTIKELYSLMDFSGEDIDPTSTDTTGLNPFIDDSVFDFEYGDTAAGSRIIDSQWVTTNKYVSTVFNGQECFFGVNFADGRIKCYPTADNGQNQGYFVRYVRNVNSGYGENDFEDQGNGTILDAASGLIWQRADNGQGVAWDEALSYCENLSFGGAEDWRLPNAKELHSIVDYSRSPDTTSSPAIDPMFSSTEITNEANQTDWGFYWTSTTHASVRSGSQAAYISFGRALGNMSEFGGWIDVHGAGAQRSDPKLTVPADQKNGFGPQGDARRADNFVRCVSSSEGLQ